MGRSGKVGRWKGPALVFAFLGIAAPLVFDGNVPAAADATIQPTLRQMLLDWQTLFHQIGTPPVGVADQLAMRPGTLLSFSEKAMQKYRSDAPNPHSPLRKAILKARLVLWAIYPGEPPEKLSTGVAKQRTRIRFQLNVPKEGYRAPKDDRIAEKNFKAKVEIDERHGALILSVIDETLKELQSNEVTAARKKESKRWQANYDFMTARLFMERAFLFEYLSMLSSIRKEFPPRNPNVQGGWKLVSRARMQGDSNGKKSDKAARKLLDKIIKDNAGTPWEVLAKREKLTNLGLEWQAVK